MNYKNIFNFNKKYIKKEKTWIKNMNKSYSMGNWEIGIWTTDEHNGADERGDIAITLIESDLPSLSIDLTLNFATYWYPPTIGGKFTKSGVTTYIFGLYFGITLTIDITSFPLFTVCILIKNSGPIPDIFTENAISSIVGTTESSRICAYVLAASKYKYLSRMVKEYINSCNVHRRWRRTRRNI